MNKNRLRKGRRPEIAVSSVSRPRTFSQRPGIDILPQKPPTNWTMVDVQKILGEINASKVASVSSTAGILMVKLAAGRSHTKYRGDFCFDVSFFGNVASSREVASDLQEFFKYVE